MATIVSKTEITLTRVIDVASNMRYYKLVSSTAAAPSKPTENPPSDWSTTEPSYTPSSTNTLYFVDCTIYSNGTFKYSDVSKSSSYEAAKEAYNKAQAAQDSVNNMVIGGRNLFRGSGTMTKDCKDGIMSVEANIFRGKYSAWKTTGAWQGMYNAISPILKRAGVKVGDTLTYSVQVMCDFTPTKAVSFTLYRLGSDADETNVVSILLKDIVMEKDKWYTVSCTFDVTEKNLNNPKQNTRLETNYYETSDHKFSSDDTKHMYFAGYKLEFGSKATDWTPAPEDFETELDNTRKEFTDYQSSITNELGTIRTDASETRTTLNGKISDLSELIGDIDDIDPDATIAKILKTYSSSITQNATDITAVINKQYQTSADVNDIVDAKVLSEREYWQTYLRFNENGLTLGRSDSDFLTVLTNTMLAFRQSGLDVAYISNLALYITQAIIKERLIFGADRSDKQQFVWSFGDTGTLDLTYEGE